MPARRWLNAHGDRALPLVAGALILASLALPYWQLDLRAPQYPRGLHVTLWVYKVEGDILEIDGLNHYIGMTKLDGGGERERAVAPFALPILAGLATLAAVRRRGTWLLAIPPISLPLVFVGDLFYWLFTFGHNLDPRAALSSSIHEFTPVLLGPGKVGQFRTTGYFHIGWYLAFLATIMLIAAIVIRRRRDRAAHADA